MSRRVSKRDLTHLLLFVSSNISLEFMQNLRVNVFSKLAMSQDLEPIPCHQEVLQGWPNAFAFLSIGKYHLEFYAKFEGQRFLETGDVSRPGTNFL